MNLPKYPVVEYISMPIEVNAAIRTYCIEQDLHPHNGTYVDYDVSFEFPHTNNILEMWLHSVGVREEHEKVLIHFDY